MFPAARIGDPITHDMLVPSGTIAIPAGPPTVIIEGMPAATVGAGCACTGAISGAIAHPPLPAPSPILTGSTTVLITSLPAARWLPAPDAAACGSLLGDMKLAATRTVVIGG